MGDAVLVQVMLLQRRRWCKLQDRYVRYKVKPGKVPRSPRFEQCSQLELGILRGQWVEGGVNGGDSYTAE